MRTELKSRTLFILSNMDSNRTIEAKAEWCIPLFCSHLANLVTDYRYTRFFVQNNQVHHLSSFQLSVVKSKPKQSLWPITGDSKNKLNQSELEVNTRNTPERGKTRATRVVRIGFGFISGWWRKWCEFFNQSQGIVTEKQNKTNATYFRQSIEKRSITLKFPQVYKNKSDVKESFL